MAKFYKFSILLVIALAVLSSALEYNILPTETSGGLVDQDFAYDYKIVSEHEFTLSHRLFFETASATIFPEYRFHVSIEREKELLCSGAVIRYNSRQYVVTAASCGVTDTDIVRVNAAKATKGGKEYKVKCVVNHPSFKNSGANLYDNDLAIVYIDQIFAEKNLAVASPVVMPTQARTTFYGQFSNNIFKHTLVVKTVNIYSRKECEEFGFEMTDNMLCAGHFALNTSFCNMDHGSPLFNDRGLLLGIKSWGEQCSRLAVPAVYTNISSMYPWIFMTLRNKTQC